METWKDRAVKITIVFGKVVAVITTAAALITALADLMDSLFGHEE